MRKTDHYQLPIGAKTPNGDVVVERRVCKACGIGFWISSGQAAWFKARDWHLPSRCPQCKRSKRGPRPERTGS